MQRRQQYPQRSQKPVIGREKFHFFRSRQTTTKNINSYGNASIDITQLYRFDESEYYNRMKNYLFTQDEIDIIDRVSKSIPYTTDFQLLKNISHAFEEIEASTVLGLHEKRSRPGKLFVLRKIEKEVKIKPYEICLWPLHFILEGIQNKELKQNFLYCLQYVVGRQIYLSEFTEGDQDFDMMRDHFSQDGWDDDADIPDEETEDLIQDKNDNSLKYLTSEYGKKSECYKLFSKLKQKSFRIHGSKASSLSVSIEGKDNEVYFKRARVFKNKADNICFELSRQMLLLRDQKLRISVFDQHDHEHMQQFENGILYSSNMMQFCWKEDFVQNYYIENLNAMECQMTQLGIYVELTENGQAEFSPEILAYAKQISKFYQTIDKLYNTIINGRKRERTKK